MSLTEVQLISSRIQSRKILSITDWSLKNDSSGSRMGCFSVDEDNEEHLDNPLNDPSKESIEHLVDVRSNKREAFEDRRYLRRECVNRIKDSTNEIRLESTNTFRLSTSPRDCSDREHKEIHREKMKHRDQSDEPDWKATSSLSVSYTNSVPFIPRKKDGKTVFRSRVSKENQISHSRHSHISFSSSQSVCLYIKSTTHWKFSSFSSPVYSTKWTAKIQLFPESSMLCSVVITKTSMLTWQSWILSSSISMLSTTCQRDSLISMQREALLN